MELFSIRSRIIASASNGMSDAALGTRLHAAILRRAASELGPRWRGPLEEDEDASEHSTSLRPGFYDSIANSPNRVVILASGPQDGASQALRAALYRAQGASFPPVFVSPDAETVRAGALHAALRKLSERVVPVYAIDLLGVSGSAMPEALRIVTTAIGQGAFQQVPARWILLLDPLYETKIGPWSDPGFFGQVQMEHSKPIDGISLGIESEVEDGSLKLSVHGVGALASLHLGIARHGASRSSTDWVGNDVACVQRVLDASIESLRDCALIETERSVKMQPHGEQLMQLAMAYQSGVIAKDEFIDRSLSTLTALRREQPEEATPVAEFVAAYADSHPIEPVPVPDDASFVETIGPPPVVQGL